MGMMKLKTQLALVSVLVNDQDEALHFYTEKLGLEKRMDVTFGPGLRLVTVASRGLKKPEIEGMLVAYLDGHHASFWRFITAVQRIHDLADGFHDFRARPISRYQRYFMAHGCSPCLFRKFDF